MTDPRCDRLDEYLCGWLSPDEAAAFEAHLAGCPACRDEAAVQRHIDGLLAEGSAQVEPVPVTFGGSNRARSPGRAAASQFGLACAVTAAASCSGVGSLGSFDRTVPERRRSADGPGAGGRRLMRRRR